MYVNKDLNIEWWLPPRTASRMTRMIIEKLGFEQVGYHHSFNSINENRKIYINVRNPYSIIVSRYKQFNNRHISYTWTNFNEFVKTFATWVETGHIKIFKDYPETFESTNTKPFFKVRYENYLQDLMSIDFIKDNQHIIQPELDTVNQGKWNDNVFVDTTKPYYEFYDQETADIVYKLYENNFVYDGYDKESWKTITI